jgi:hypothetical protein
MRAKNALGKVKFLFRGTGFNIYFHDTPFKIYLEKDKRAYSHDHKVKRTRKNGSNYVLRNNLNGT